MGHGDNGPFFALPYNELTVLVPPNTCLWCARRSMPLGIERAAAKLFPCESPPSGASPHSHYRQDKARPSWPGDGQWETDPFGPNFSYQTGGRQLINARDAVPKLNRSL